MDAVGGVRGVGRARGGGCVGRACGVRGRPGGAGVQGSGDGIWGSAKEVGRAGAVMTFPLMFTAFRVAIETSDRRYFDVARTLGVTPVRAFLRVTLPLAWRGLLSGMLLAFCRALGEFGATILIAGNIPGRTQTLALAIYDRVQNGNDAEAAMLVAWVVAMAWVLVAISGVLIAQQRRRFAA